MLQGVIMMMKGSYRDVEGVLLVLLVGCLSGVTGVFQGIYRGVTRVLHGFYRNFTGVLQCCYRCFTGRIQQCYMGFTGVLQWVLQIYYKGFT